MVEIFSFQDINSFLSIRIIMDPIIVITAIVHIATIAYLFRSYKAAYRDSMKRRYQFES